MKKGFLAGCFSAVFLALSSCQKEGVFPVPPPVENMDWKRYLGKWYEIARYPNFFQQEGSSAIAEYLPDKRDPGKILVINSVVDKEGRKIFSIEGKGLLLPEKEKTGLLRVSFQWPFYGEYRIIFLSEDYRISIVTSSAGKFLWILSRTPHLSEEKKKEILLFLQENGFSVEKLFWDRH